MADDDFGFSDDDFDDLPANTLQHLEASAIRATQQPQQQQQQQQPQHDAAPESDYGLDDGEEVVNLDDASGPQRASPWVAADAPQYTQPQQDYDYDYGYGHGYDQQPQHDADTGDQFYNEPMEVEEPPRRSQADPNQLLQRIKKVRCPPPFQRRPANHRS